MTDRQAASKTPLVFVIEDNPADVRLVEEGAEAAGADLDLRIIKNGQEAIEQLVGIEPGARDQYPDLILLDLNLPGKSGFDVLEMIRSETTFQDVPVVVVSSSENSDDVRSVYASDANAYVMKPADPDEYIQMVTTAIDFWIATVTRFPNDD